MSKNTATAIVNPSLIATGPGGVVPLRGKKRRLTGAELKARTDQARSITGYSPSSPIFGKQTPDVLTAVDAFLRVAAADLNVNDIPSARAEIEAARNYIEELQKRIATRKLAFAR